MLWLAALRASFLWEMLRHFVLAESDSRAFSIREQDGKCSARCVHQMPRVQSQHERSSERFRLCCARCRRKATSESNSLKASNKMLPVWHDDDGTPQHHVPPELSELTVAEVLLTQRESHL